MTRSVVRAVAVALTAAAVATGVVGARRQGAPPSATPSTAPGAALGDPCCDSTCGIILPAPCAAGLVCKVPATPTPPPGLVVDGQMGACVAPATRPPRPPCATPSTAPGATLGESCCDSTCGIIPPAPCAAGLVCKVPATPTPPPGLVVDGQIGTCVTPATAPPRPPGATPSTAPGAALGESCCDSTCGIILPAPCVAGLECDAPEPSLPPGVVLDGWMGKCVAA